MSDKDELAKLLFIADNQDSEDPDHEWEMTTRHDPDFTKYAFALADAILAAGYRKPRIITTVEELDALPTDSTVRSDQGGIWVKAASGRGCVWTDSGRQWWHWHDDIALPATVLYAPEPTP